VIVAHGIRQPRRFEREVKTVGAEGIERGQIEALQDVEQYQRGQPLRIGRQFQHVETAIIGADGRDHFAAMAGEILSGKERAAGGNGRNDIVGDRPFVERVRTVRRDRPERVGERRQLDHVALGRGLAVE
jgi:hypothetical protein